MKSNDEIEIIEEEEPEEVEEEEQEIPAPKLMASLDTELSAAIRTLEKMEDGERKNGSLFSRRLKKENSMTEAHQKYQELRKKNIPAAAALRIAKDASPPIEFPWERVGRGNTIKKATFDKEGFRCVISVEYDYDHDFTQDRGVFTNTVSPGAIEYPPAHNNSSVFAYFVPDNDVAYHRNELTKQGMAKQEAEVLALKYVREDMLIAGDPEGQGYVAYGVTASVFFRDVELADASVWGIEISDRKYDDDPYIHECAQGVLDEALSDAKRKLAELRKPEQRT